MSKPVTVTVLTLAAAGAAQAGPRSAVVLGIEEGDAMLLAVGVVLIVATLITPAAAARVVVERLDVHHHLHALRTGQYLALPIQLIRAPLGQLRPQFGVQIHPPTITRLR